MIGFPIFSGFISKLLFAQAAVGHTYKMLPTLIALAISTILNTIYFMKTVIRIYTPMRNAGGREKKNSVVRMTDQPLKSAALVSFILMNVILGLRSETIVVMIQNGLKMFG